MSSEFDIIQDYFNWQQAKNIASDVISDPISAPTSNTVRVGIGDDAAVLNLKGRQGQELVISVDTFIEGVHFPENTPAEAIGHKALAVNLSDLAAMGADPAWFTLAISLPEFNHEWLKAFSAGLKKLADQHNIVLIGGDTTRGALSITIQVMGFVEAGKALLRSTAKPKDKLYVTGNLGDAAVGLAIIQQRLKSKKLSQSSRNVCQQALNYPQAQNTLSQVIRPYVNACLDISDGLLQDLQHILQASNVGAKIILENIPLSSATLELGRKHALPYALSGGDDYQLLLTVSPENNKTFLDEIAHHKLQVTCIGEINTRCLEISDCSDKRISATGYQHFYG